MVRIVRHLVVLAALLGAQAHAAPSIWTEPVTGMRFVTVPKGCFQMGTRKSVKPMDIAPWVHANFRGKLEADEQPRHEACVDAFLIGQHEVRASDWERVMGEAPPQGQGASPAAGMTWHAAQAFAARLTQLSEQSGAKYRFRLPTEAEWEYACRAGVKKESVPSRREDRRDVAWYNLQRAPEPREVGRRKANPWALHDMLGNVWEWVEDSYRADAYARHALFNPVVRDAGAGERVIRGASHRSDFLHVRCGKRASYAAEDALGQIGLRLVRTK
jgi:formylglycine-generating enzyme required for sulfatase activity